MADPAHTDAAIVEHLNHQPFTRGEMPINEQTSTFHVFDWLVRWGSLSVASVILFLTLNFCTSAGFLTAAVCALVLAGVGFVVLRKKPTSLETL